MKRYDPLGLRSMPAAHLLAWALVAQGLLAAALRLGGGGEAAVRLLMPGAVAGGLLLSGSGLLLAARPGRIARRLGDLAALLLMGGSCAGLLAGGALPGDELPLAVLLVFAASGGFLFALRRRWLLFGQPLAGMVGLLAWLSFLCWLFDWEGLGILPGKWPLPKPNVLFGLCLLALGVFGLGVERGHWRTFYAGRHDRRLVVAGGALVLVMVLSIGMLGLTLAARLLLASHDSVIQAALTERRARIDHLLRDAVVGAEAALAAVEGCAGADAAACWRGLHTAFPAGGWRALHFARPGPAVSMAGETGLLAERGWLVADGRAELIWRDQPLLAVFRSPAGAAGGAALRLVVALPGLVPGLSAGAFGASGETVFAAGRNGEFEFLPTRFAARPFAIPYGKDKAMAMAVRGEAGRAIGPDYRAVDVVAAFAPLAPGVGMVQKLDLAEVMQPLRQWLWAVLGGSLMLGGAGCYALYLVLFPLARRLQRQERRYRAFLDNAPMAIVLAGEDGRIDACNASAERLFACSGDYLQGRSLAALFDEPGIERLLGELLPGCERSLCCAAGCGNGRTLPVEAHFRRDVVDGRHCLLAVIDDRSEQLARQAELETWETVFMNATWGIVLGDAAGQTLLDLNPAFARMHGYERAELLGRPIVVVFAPAERAGLQAHVEQAHRQGRHCFESVHLRKDGSQFPVRIDVSTVRDRSGQIRLRIVNVQDISRRNEMERRLRDSEQMRRMVLDTQRDMIVRYLPDSTVLFANLAYAEIFGHSPESIIGQRWLELVAVLQPAVAGELTEKLAKQVQQPRRIEHLLHIEHVTAGPLWVQWTTLPLYDESGGLQGFQSSGHDVTARKAAEDALLLSESWFRTLFESMFHHALVLDTAGRIVAVNRNAAAFLGQAHHELLGRIPWEIESLKYSAEQRQRRQEIVERVARGEEVSLESVVTSRQGREHVFDFTYRPIIGPDGQARYILIEGHDITSFREQERRISEREARFQGVAENMPGIVFEFIREDGRWRGIYVNQASASLLGVDREAFESGGVSLADCLHPDDREGFLAALESCERRQRELRWVGRLARARGGWVSICASQRRSGGRAVWSGVGLDITEIKETELEIERSRAELRELAAHYENVREDERRVMAREVHDELGQNLTALRMGLSVLAAQPGRVPVADEAKRLKGLVDQSISVVRGIARSLRPAAMDLGIASALRWLASEFESNSGIRCELDIDLGHCRLEDERATMLFRIAQESLTNVARHAEATRVWVRMRHINRFVILEVGDNGRGFVVSERVGGGFGLLGMKERALSLGGELAIFSRPGEGAVVSVHIPLE